MNYAQCQCPSLQITIPSRRNQNFDSVKTGIGFVIKKKSRASFVIRYTLSLSTLDTCRQMPFKRRLQLFRAPSEMYHSESEFTDFTSSVLVTFNL